LCFGSNQSRAQTYTLSQAIDYAINHSLMKEQIELNYLASEASFKAYQASRLPQLALNAGIPGFSRTIRSVTQPDGTITFVPVSQTFSNAGLGFNQFINPTGSQIYIRSSLNRFALIGDSAALWQASPMVFGISQPVFGATTRRFDNQIAELRFEVQSKRKLRDLEQMKVQVASRYFDVYLAQEDVRISALNVALNDSLFQLSRGRYNVGKISENDLLQVELNVIRAKNQLEIAQTGLANAKANLNILLGRSPDAPVTAIPEIELPNPQIPIALAVEKAFANGMQELQRRLSLLNAKQDYINQKNATRPTGFINAEVGLNRAGESLESSYNNLQSQQTATFQVNIPIVTWGQNKNRRKEVEMQYQSLQVNAEIQRLELEQAVKSSVLNYLQAQSSLEIAAKADTIAQRRYSAASNRYLIGKIGITDLFIAQQERDAARRSYLETLRQFWVSYYGLRGLTLYDFEQEADL
jgi:outer membrane protein TolC